MLTISRGIFTDTFFYIEVTTVIGSFIEPRLFGKEIGFRPWWYFFLWCSGEPVGMLFSVPLP